MRSLINNAKNSIIIRQARSSGFRHSGRRLHTQAAGVERAYNLARLAGVLANYKTALYTPELRVQGSILPNGMLRTRRVLAWSQAHLLR